MTANLLKLLPAWVSIEFEMDDGTARLVLRDVDSCRFVSALAGKIDDVVVRVMFNKLVNDTFEAEHPGGTKALMRKSWEAAAENRRPDDDFAALARRLNEIGTMSDGSTMSAADAWMSLLQEPA